MTLTIADLLLAPAYSTKQGIDMTVANQQKPKRDMGYVVVGIITAGIFAMIMLAAALLEEEDPQAILLAQQKWAQNDLLLNSLQRYTAVYQKLDRAVDKKALALSYVQRITKDLLMFPSKDGARVRVVLPTQTVDNTTVMVLKEISLGTSDNGLFKAFRNVLDPAPRREPPIYIAEVDQLLRYVISGNGNTEIVAGINK
jgi:hypothetical protein